MSISALISLSCSHSKEFLKKSFCPLFFSAHVQFMKQNQWDGTVMRNLLNDHVDVPQLCFSLVLCPFSSQNNQMLFLFPIFSQNEPKYLNSKILYWHSISGVFDIAKISVYQETLKTTKSFKIQPMLEDQFWGADCYQCRTT